MVMLKDVIVAEQEFIDTLEGTYIQTSYNTVKVYTQMVEHHYVGSLQMLETTIIQKWMSFMIYNLLTLGHLIKQREWNPPSKISVRW